MTTGNDSTIGRFEAALALRGKEPIELTLIVSGASDLSARAVANVTRICETHLAGRYHLAVVDLHEAPASVLSGQVLAAPTLVKTRPLPIRKFVGDLSRAEKVLTALGISIPDLPTAST